MKRSDVRHLSVKHVLAMHDKALAEFTRARLAEEIAAEIGRRRGLSGPPVWFDFDDGESES